MYLTISGSRRGDQLPVQSVSGQSGTLQFPQRQPQVGPPETQADDGPAIQTLALSGVAGVLREPGEQGRIDKVRSRTSS